MAAGLLWFLWSPGRARRPVAVPVTPVRSAVRESTGTVLHVTTSEAPARLLLDSVASRAGRVLFYAGRPTRPWGERSVVVDSSGAVLAFDEHLKARWVALETGSRRLTGIAASADGGLWGASADGEISRYGPDGRLRTAVHSRFAAPNLAADLRDDGVWASRSAQGSRLQLPEGTSPIFEWLGASDSIPRTVGTAFVPGHGLLQDLANAGDIVAADGAIYFAPFVRDEVVAMTSAGDTLWVAHRALPQARGEPRFEIRDGRATIDYHPVNLGIALGPDRLLYVLSTPGFSTTTGRLDVFEPATGALLRTVPLPTALPTIAVDPDGRVALLDPIALLTGTAPAERPDAPPIDLPTLEGGRLALAALRGRVVLLNTWASWCAPAGRRCPGWRRSPGGSTLTASRSSP